MPKTKANVDDDALSELAQEAANEVERIGMELPIPQYIEFIEDVQQCLGDMLRNSQGDLKRQEASGCEE